MKNQVKVILVPPSVQTPQEIEDLINGWVKKGWLFVQMSSFANKTYIILQRLVIG